MIYKLELENYRCYTSFTKDFSDTLNIISGANGTGKTTIVEAIGFALFGNKVTRGKASSWVRHGSKHGKVVLHIDDFIITRGDNEQLVESTDGTVLARQHSGVDEWIEKHYGLTYELYGTANYIAQKDIESFSGLQAAERIKRVEKLLRIDVIDDVQKKVKAELTTTRRDLNEYTRKTSGSSYEPGTVTTLKAALESAEEKYQSAESKHNKALIEYGSYTEKKKKWERLLELKSVIDSLKNTEFPISKEEMIGLRELLKTSAKSMKELVKFNDVEASDRSEELIQLRDLYTSTKSRLEEVQSITDNCTLCGQNVPDSSYINDLIATLEKQLVTFTTKGEQYKRQTEKKELESKIVHNTEWGTLADIEQMISDYSHNYEIIEYNRIKDAKNPDFLDISDIEKVKKTKWKELNQVRQDLVYAEKNKSVYETYGDLIDTTKNKLHNLEKLSKFTDDYRKEFTKNVVPLIHENAEKIFNYLTADKYSNFEINQDYSVSGYDVYSGSEADAASFAIRMAIAKTSRIKNFNSVILDEISSSFDTQKEEILIDLLRQSNNQIIYISHGDIV
tara:strand:+ start:25 stop:1716 length:1692 start_codon:yes stop_codon:yes gene_type:complete